MIELNGPGNKGEVRFELFGRFRIYVGDQEVASKDAAFYSYLKLLLLSGQTHLDKTSSCPLWVSRRGVRQTVDKGNSRRRPFQGGRFDFTGETGASLKFRDGLGLHFQGASCRSDIEDFEDVWDRRSSASHPRPKATNDELLGALSQYGKGVDIQSWKKDPILIACSNWIEYRLAVLNAHRDDIQAELDSRLDSSELAHSELTSATRDEHLEELNEEEGIHHEISGFDNGSTEVESGEISSTVLRDPLCQDDEPNEQVHEAVTDETEGSERFEQQPGSESEGELDPPADSSDPPSGVGSGMAEQETTAFERGRDLPLRRNVTALGVLITGAVMVVMFASGYLIGSGRQAPSEPQNQGFAQNQGSPQDQGSPQSNLEQKPNVTTPGGTTLGTEDPVEETPIVRASENPISLDELFLRDIGGMSKYSEEDMVIGRQLFPHYVYSYAGGDTVPAYKLAGQFRKVTCIVGVADENENNFVDKSGRVLFEGDGKILKRLEVQPGQAVPVSLEVTGIKVLVISFRFPVVIASPKAFR
ncbi:MAG: hypothetical protein M3R13_08630 [Armatimonadota bacterium]|nr:hypothetical protein [Armatimonadota bacterium]